MERDMELVRLLLTQVAADPKYNGRSRYHVQADDFEAEGFSNLQIDYHLALLIEAGLLIGEPMGSPGYIISRPSWQGHEFLADTKDTDVWQKTKERAKVVGGAGLGFMWEIAKAEIKVKLGLP